ncbi:MAG: DUF1828 domain-containing protein [Pseudomonadota bacterium]
MKEELCRAFCDDISLTEVPSGLAIGTAFRRDDGDRIAFFVIETDKNHVRLEDDGATIPYLAEAGVEFETETRRRALDELLSKAEATIDDDDPTIRTFPFLRDKIGKRAIEFVSLMIRMHDFLLLTQEKVASSFREDAAERIRLAIGDRARIRENEPVSASLSETSPDLIIEAKDRTPVAVFFGNSSNRVHDAIFLHQAATYEIRQELSVVALLEDDNSVSQELRRRASNRLASVPVYHRDEEAAIARISREAIGLTVH